MASTILSTGNSFTNSYILKGDRAAAIIDAGLPGYEKKIFAALDANGIARDQVKLLILTHGHGDHYGSLKALKAAFHAPVMAGWPDASYVEKGESAPVVPVNLTGRMIKLFTGAKASPCKVDVVVKEDMNLSAYGIDARVLTMPGHTMGSLAVLASDGGCAVGDNLAALVLKNSPGMPPFAESPDMIGAGLKKVLDNGATDICPGHGNRWEASTVRKKFATIIA
ncbi:MBL fold metallo-hydrolase [Methanocella sp. MCL-LM]|uniref:MBL fold metallo-hydrolase n=1 Tax=Methanocella sp. MCL-LM TaxID=3412035 RepID=UPI003C7857B2